MRWIWLGVAIVLATFTLGIDAAVAQASLTREQIAEQARRNQVRANAAYRARVNREWPQFFEQTCRGRLAQRDYQPDKDVRPRGGFDACMAESRRAMELLVDIQYYNQWNSDGSVNIEWADEGLLNENRKSWCEEALYSDQPMIITDIFPPYVITCIQVLRHFIPVNGVIPPAPPVTPPPPPSVNVNRAADQAKAREGFAVQFRDRIHHFCRPESGSEVTGVGLYMFDGIAESVKWCLAANDAALDALAAFGPSFPETLPRRVGGAGSYVGWRIVNACQRKFQPEKLVPLMLYACAITFHRMFEFQRTE